MTETPDSTPETTAAKKRGSGLSSMLLADLKSMAAGMGVPGAGSMKKAQLVDAIKGAQESSRAAAAARQQDAQQAAAAPQQAAAAPEAPAEAPAPVEAGASAEAGSAEATGGEGRQRTRQRTKQGQAQQVQAQQGQAQQGQAQQGDEESRGGKTQPEKSQKGQGEQVKQPAGKQQQTQANRAQNRNQDHNRNQDQNQNRSQDQDRSQGQDRNHEHGGDVDGDDDGEGGSRRNRRRRGRERTVSRPGRGEPDTTILEDDVLVPAAGILDVLDNYAFVRTSGYLPGTDDVYLSLSIVRKYGLRRGDAVVGQVRQPREGERREKFNPMVRIDSVNGADPEASKDRPEFSAGTPVHPDQRLRLSTDSSNIIGRVIDVVTPIGKGQRGLIYAPPASGTTPLMRSIATSITTNNPECHVMVVLVDERPEEVTDYQRSVKGEVIASTFDRQPADHVMVAELSIERAKRLVELGHDVVVLLDSITRLGRAYNLLAPANGRVLAAGVDASAIHPPKQFFGAARNLEDGGSLTILATVSDSGAAIDELFVEELAGTSNLELRLTRERAALGLAPAVDPAVSATRHEELLLAPAEAAVVGDVRRQLAAATTQAALEKVVAGSR